MSTSKKAREIFTFVNVTKSRIIEINSIERQRRGESFRSQIYRRREGRGRKSAIINGETRRMKMKVRKQIKKFTATFLTLALLLTMLPTIALAEDQELIKFKNMQMDVLRNNAPVSLYDYASKENDFIRGLAFNLDQTWVKLNYVISYSQYVKLELYRMEDGTSEDGQNWNEDNPLFLESKITDNPDDGYGANLKEPFLGEYLGYLKNWLFSNTPAGAQSSAVIYSLIETAKENDLDPYRYLVWLLHNAPDMSRTDEAWAESFLPVNAPQECRSPKS